MYDRNYHYIICTTTYINIAINQYYGRGGVLMSKGTNRKHRRNIERPANKRYNAENRALSNKLRKLQKQVDTHPTDMQAKCSLDRLLK